MLPELQDEMKTFLAAFLEAETLAEISFEYNVVVAPTLLFFKVTCIFSLQAPKPHLELCSLTSIHAFLTE